MKNSIKNITKIYKLLQKYITMSANTQQKYSKYTSYAKFDLKISSVRDDWSLKF